MIFVRLFCRVEYGYDESGSWKIGFSRNLGDMVLSNNAFVVELLAIKSGLDLIISMDLPQVIIESDSL